LSGVVGITSTEVSCISSFSNYVEKFEFVFLFDTTGPIGKDNHAGSTAP